MIAALLFLLTASLTPEQEARIEAISADIRCVVCQNQSIAESEAELAQVMRGIVTERVVLGDSDEEVRAYLTARYGETVLLTPTRSGKNALLWTAPALALLVGGGLVFSLFRRPAKARP